MTRGFKSSEFWLNLATIVSLTLLKVLGEFDTEFAVILGGVTGAYTLGRSAVKRSQGGDDDGDVKLEGNVTVLP